jgi:hypothetical protein
MSTPEEQFFNELYTHYGFSRRGKILNHMLIPTPIKNSLGEIDNRWYRAPSPGDGSCLFHSVIMNILSDEARPDIAKSLRLAIANSLSLVDYTNIQGGILSMLNIHIALQDKLSLSSFNSNPNEITEKEFKNKIDEIITNNSSINDIIEFRDKFISEVENLGFDRDEIKEIFKGYYMSTYLEYVLSLKNLNQWADQSISLLLSQKLKVNVIIISSIDMKVYKDTSTFNPNYISIVIFNIDGAHFEPMVMKEKEDIDDYRTTFSLKDLETIF